MDYLPGQMLFPGLVENPSANDGQDCPCDLETGSETLPGLLETGDVVTDGGSIFAGWFLPIDLKV